MADSMASAPAGHRAPSWRRRPRDPPTTATARRVPAGAGALRKSKGRLVPTPRGRTLATDPVGLWRQLADALPIGGRDVTDASWQASVLLLAVMTTGSTDRADAVIAQLLTGLGWVLEGGQPIDRRTVAELTADDVHFLRRIGALEGDRLGEWPGQLTSGGIALARAALANE
jgi:hypothetical protein